jgi:hypothetical protein
VAKHVHHLIVHDAECRQNRVPSVGVIDVLLDCLDAIEPFSCRTSPCQPSASSQGRGPHQSSTLRDKSVKKLSSHHLGRRMSLGVATSRSLVLHCRNQSNPLFYAREPCNGTLSSHAAASVDAEVLTRLLCAGSPLRATSLRTTSRLPPTVVAICTQTVPTPASTDLAIWLAKYRQAIDRQVAIGRGNLAIRPGLNSTRKSTSCIVSKADPRLAAVASHTRLGCIDRAVAIPSGFEKSKCRSRRPSSTASRCSTQVVVVHRAKTPSTCRGLLSDELSIQESP